jgi:DNA end-binding protein Ku
MARAFWKGSISFGLVEIPVSLRPAVKENDLSFSLLDQKDFSPVGNKRYNKKTGRDVPWDEVVRGLEYEPDEYVVLTEEELRRANVEASESIEILEFVDAGEIDPVFYETPYYVEPLKRASKSYALLRSALEKSGKVGVARVMLRTRRRLAALLVRDQVLVLDLMRYAHELRSQDEVSVPPKSAKGAGVSEKEIKMAEQLIAGMTAKWNPAKYRDEYHDDVMSLVRRKVRAGQIHTIIEPEEAPERRRARSEVVDLMPLLKRSIAARVEGVEGRHEPKAKRERAGSGTRRRRSA